MVDTMINGFAAHDGKRVLGCGLSEEAALSLARLHARPGTTAIAVAPISAVLMGDIEQRGGDVPFTIDASGTLQRVSQPEMDALRRGPQAVEPRPARFSARRIAEFVLRRVVVLGRPSGSARSARSHRFGASRATR